MPNHVTSNIYLKGNTDRIRELLEAIKNNEYGVGSIDFNKIIPMPESLDITSGSETVRCHKIYKDFLNVYTLTYTGESIDFLNIPLVSEEEYLKERPEVSKEDFILGKQVFINTQLYNAPTWYEWRNDNWGTKWNAYGYSDDIDTTEYIEEAKIYCVTAWSAPHLILEQLSQMYPDIEFTHEWADEDIGNNCGRRILQNGECIETYNPESSKEAIEFATSVQGYSDPKEFGLMLNASETDYISIYNWEYERVTICGVNALFTNEKLTLKDIPKGTHCYYLRSSDDGAGFSTLEPEADVNVAGTIITCESIEIPKQGYIELTDKNYPVFVGKDYSFEQFIDENSLNVVKPIDKISVLLIEPRKYPKVVEIENTLDAMQKIVGGNIESFSPFEEEITLICNDEGKQTGLPLNRAIYAEPEKTEMTYSELKSVFRESELKGEHLTAHIIFTEDTFDKPYTEFERTYVVNSNNKAFQANMGGYSIYGGSLDGVDRCVRLERYMADEHGGKNGWKIEKCYLLDNDKEMIEIMAGTFLVVGTTVESENFTSLTHEQTLKYGKLFESPERFYKDQNKKIIAEPFSPVRDDNAR